MARKASVRYWESRGAYCCWFQGKPYTLAVGPDDAPNGPTYSAACKRFGQIVTGATDGPTVGEIVREYLVFVRRHQSAGTASVRECYLARLPDQLLQLPFRFLTRRRAQEWADSEGDKKGWKPNTKRTAMQCLSAAVGWALKQGEFDGPGVRGMVYPKRTARGEEHALSAEQVAAVVSACKPSDLPLISCLRDTGARPGELARVEARHFKGPLRALILPAVEEDGSNGHKNARTGKPRTIYLAGESLPIVENLVAQFPSGPLFRYRMRRTGKGGPSRALPWDNAKLFALFRRLKKATGIPHLIAYSFRHTFACNWLKAYPPLPAIALAEVLGTSLEQIVKTYGHLAEQREYLRSLVDRIVPPAHPVS